MNDSTQSSARLTQVAATVMNSLAATLEVTPWILLLLTIGTSPTRWAVAHSTASIIAVPYLGLLSFSAVLLVGLRMSRGIADHFVAYPCYPDERYWSDWLRPLLGVILLGGFLLPLFSVSFLLFALITLTIDATACYCSTKWNEGILQTVFQSIKCSEIKEPALRKKIVQDEIVARSILSSESVVWSQEKSSSSWENEEHDTAEETDEGTILRLDDPHLSQYQQRRTDQWGTETIQGMVRLVLKPNQEWATVHLSFCPPLPYTPEIDLELESEALLQTKSIQSFPYGARLEIKRENTSTSATDREVTLYYFVSPVTEPAVC